MANKLDVLYISYDGMTDPLGRSQVIPYLQQLTTRGYRIAIMSFEKEKRFAQDCASVAEILDKSGIQWFPLRYTARPPVLSTMYDIWRMKRKANIIHKTFGFSLVHCRSYIAAFAGLSLRRNKSIPFIFDMRGFWADERVDGRLWNLSNPIYRWIFKYFKKKEKEFLNKSAFTVTLTEAAREEIRTWNLIDGAKQRIAVIPCCADTEHFSPMMIDSVQKKNLAGSMNLSDHYPVISYLGSTGTWYMLDEMIGFFKTVLEKYPTAAFLVVTHDEPEGILRAATKKNIPTQNIIIRGASRNEVPLYLSLSDYNLFFIRPVYSKKASSPTKLAEVMSMGVPVICNAGVGDIDNIFRQANCGILIDELNEKTFCEAVNKITRYPNSEKIRIRDEALHRFALKSGVETYAGIYHDLLNIPAKVQDS